MSAVDLSELRYAFQPTRDCRNLDGKHDTIVAVIL